MHRRRDPRKLWDGAYEEHPIDLPDGVRRDVPGTWPDVYHKEKAEK